MHWLLNLKINPRTKTTKKRGHHFSGFSSHQMRPSNLQILITRAPFRHVETPASRIMTSQYFCRPDRCTFAALMCSPNECGWSQVTLEPTSVCLLCVGPTDNRYSVSHISCSASPSKATLLLNNVPECPFMVILSLVKIAQGTDACRCQYAPPDTHLSLICGNEYGIFFFGLLSSI